MKVFTLYAMPLGPSPSPTRSPTRAPTASVRVTRIEKEGYAMAAMAKAIPTLTQLNNGNYLILSHRSICHIHVGQYSFDDKKVKVFLLMGVMHRVLILSYRGASSYIVRHSLTKALLFA